MKPMIRILSLGALVLVGLIAALYFALPSNRLDISFPTSAEPGIGTPSPLGSTHGDHIAPPVLSATAGVNQVTVSWPAVAGASTYEIWARTGDGDWSQVDGGSLSGASTSFTHDQLTAGTLYYYTGRTVPTSGHKSTWAPQTSATVLAPSGVPALTAAPAIGKIELSWSAVTGADSYHLITWTDGQADWERIGDPITGTVTRLHTHRAHTRYLLPLPRQSRDLRHRRRLVRLRQRCTHRARRTLPHRHRRHRPGRPQLDDRHRRRQLPTRHVERRPRRLGPHRRPPLPTPSPSTPTPGLNPAIPTTTVSMR